MHQLRSEKQRVTEIDIMIEIEIPMLDMGFETCLVFSN